MSRRVPARWLLPGILTIAMLLLGGALSPARPPGDMVHRVDMGDHKMSVLIAPQRPGWNLVLLAGEHAAAGPDRTHLTPATRRPGAPGSWALIQLPRGASTLWVRQHGHLFEVSVDAGQGPSTLDITGPDGPECTSALLGRALAGGTTVTACPARALHPNDGAALRSTIGFIAARGGREVTLVEDGSPRSAAAAREVRGAAAEHGVTVNAPEQAGGPVVVVSGWAPAEAALRGIASGGRPTDGAYLAPWLLTTPLLTISAGVLIPLRYSPGDELPTRYRAALAASLPGASPSGSGYAAWLGEAPDAPVRLYAPLTVDLHPTVLTATVKGRQSPHHHEDGGDWLPGGRLTAVSPPLPAR